MKEQKSSLPVVRHPLSRRLSIGIVVFAAVIFVAALSYIYVVSRNAMLKEVVRGASRELENTVLRVNSIMEDVEQISYNLEWLIVNNLDHPDMMMDFSREMVTNNSFLNGCSISFEPYYYPSKGKYYSCYSNNNGKAIYTRQEGNDQYQYFYLDWYLMPKLLRAPYWTEPYTDQELTDDSTMDSKMMVSYCRPIILKDSTFVGSFSLDVSLEWLSGSISAVKPYSNSYSILVGRGGTYLVHPDPEKLFYQTIFTSSMNHPDSEIWDLGHDMLNRQEGMREINVQGKRSYVFYKPLETTGWSVAIVCPEKDIFGGFYRLQSTVLAIVFLGLLSMFLVFWRVIKHELKPLSRLADQARFIAAGHFERKLPPSPHMDEIGALNHSFGEMQNSLVSYIKELTSATAKKERIEGELRIARNIQMGMVPNTFPPFPGRDDIDLFAVMVPAKEVGGDLYDYSVRDGKLFFCIGDVSGKGVPASLFMAVVYSLFRTLSRQGLSPSEIASRINDSLAERNEQLIFVTMFIGRLDLETGQLDYCNCGHNPPVLLTDQPRMLDCKPNLPIGIVVGQAYEGQSIPDFKHTPIFLYTDGLNEAENLSHEEFGNERMLAKLQSRPFSDAQTVIQSMRSAVNAHVGNAEPSDDLTMLCIRYQ